MATPSRLELPIRLGKPSEDTQDRGRDFDDSEAQNQTSIDVVADKTSTENATSTADQASNCSNGDNGSDDDQSTFDLASVKIDVPRQNYSAHRNIKLLPGLDFGISEGAPFTSQQNSGLVKHLLLPGKDAAEIASYEGLIKVSNRIRLYMVTATRAYQTAPGLVSVRDVCYHALRELRNAEQSWNFRSAVRKAVAIWEKVINARKQFSSRHNDDNIHQSFRPFLEAIDDFIRIVESDVEAKEATRNSTWSKTTSNINRKRALDDMSNKIWVPSKVPRLSPEADSEDRRLAEMTPEEQIAFWRSRSKNVEARLGSVEQQYREAKNAASRKDIEWRNRMFRLWDLTRPSVNVEMRQQGQLGWKEDQLATFLRRGQLADDAEAILGTR